MLYRHTVAVVACAVSLLTSSAFAASVNVAGKEWRQVSETLGYSWTQIAGVCPAGGGVCTGSLVGADFTGWTWATIEEVGNLLFPVYNPSFPGGISAHTQAGSPWAPAFLTDFYATDTTHGYDYVFGWTATPADGTGSYAANVTNWSNGGLFDEMKTNIVRLNQMSDPTLGAWLYHPIPLPPALPLMGLAMAGLGFTRKRRPAQPVSVN